MTRWNHTLNIKQFLTEDESWEGIALAANSVAKELQRLPEAYLNDYTFQDDILFLESVDKDDSEVYDSTQELLDEVNYRLGSVYDFADSNKIWLG